MNIAIVAPSPVPFQMGGAENLFWGITSGINRLTPHNAELIKIPCLDRQFWPLIEGYQAFSRLDLNHFDMVISSKYPAWAVQHPNHHVYLQHTCRKVYDLYWLRNLPVDFIPDHPDLKPLDSILKSEPSRRLMPGLFEELFRLRDKKKDKKRFSFPGPLTRAVIHWLDKACLSRDQIQNYNAISANVAARKNYFPAGVRVQVIHHPPGNTEFFSGPGNYIFTASRLENLKRIDLLLQAFAKVDTDLELRIAGTGAQEKKLREMAENDHRVRFLGYVAEHELVRHYAQALFVPFVPYDEDYGLITPEAMASGKPVVTCRDSGGVQELVQHGENGLVAEPGPEDLARAMQELVSNPEKARLMGQKARESVSGITWENTVKAILNQNKSRTTICVPRRKKLVVASTSQATPVDSGDKQRIFHLCRELAGEADVVLVCLGSAKASGQPEQPAQGLTEISIPRSRQHAERDSELKHLLGTSVRDISAIEGFEYTPQFLEELDRQCRDADLAVLARPFLSFALRRVFSGPIWYDAHSVEFDIKNEVLPESNQKAYYIDQVHQAEAAACAHARAVLSVSRADAARLADLYGTEPGKIIQVPNGMDFSRADPYRLSGSKRAGLKKRLGLESVQVALFMGSYNPSDNQAARVLANMARDCPETVFLVTGSAGQSLELKNLPRNVHVLGVIDEAEKAVALNAADVGLNPVTRGSGSNLRLLEYIAFGIPVLTTPFGLRGHDFIPEHEVLQAEIEDFPDRLQNIREQNFEVLCNMAARAMERARKNYKWSSAAAPALQLLKETPPFNPL